MLAYELYLKNKKCTVEAVKTVVPIKKVFVMADDKVTIQLDSKTLEHYGENLNPKVPVSYFQESLSMPSNNLASVGLPYRGTGAAAKKPYVEFYGSYKKCKLSLSLTGEGKEQKEKYEYGSPKFYQYCDYRFCCFRDVCTYCRCQDYASGRQRAPRKNNQT